MFCGEKKMNDLNVVATSVIGLSVVWASWPPILAGFARMLSYWTRGRIKLTPMRSFWEWVDWEWLDVDTGDGEDTAIIAWLLFHVLGTMAFVTVLIIPSIHFPVATVTTLGVLVVAIFVPRYIVDVTHSLRFNFKKADSERLLELEKEIAKLKGE
jgi:hypothetical protein